jgi:hypothetical protein
VPGGGNGKLKPTQKSVGVYIGPKDSAISELLELVCRKFDVSESELLRKIFREKLIEWNLLDPKDNQPVAATVEKIKSEIDDAKGRLPKSL